VHIAVDFSSHEVGLLIQLRLGGIQGLPSGDVILLHDVLHSAQSARHERHAFHDDGLHLRGLIEGALV
jgi:hypothetical protein